MANPIKGEVAFAVDGRSYVLRYSADAIVHLENELDRGVVDIFAEMMSWEKDPRRIRMGLIRSVLWAGLQERHAEVLQDGQRNPDGVDIKQAGELIIGVGGIEKAFAFITDALKEAFPQAETKGARPPNRAARRRAAAGTGKAS